MNAIWVHYSNQPLKKYMPFFLYAREFIDFFRKVGEDGGIRNSKTMKFNAFMCVEFRIPLLFLWIENVIVPTFWFSFVYCLIQFSYRKT